MFIKEFTANDLRFSYQHLRLVNYREMVDEIYKGYKGGTND